MDEIGSGASVKSADCGKRHYSFDLPEQSSTLKTEPVEASEKQRLARQEQTP
jgi:hypothetical protein